MDPKIENFLGNAKKWGPELAKLRAILLECGLTEELKWGAPCYAFQKTNVAIIGELKDGCVLSFFKGALLKDAKGILTKPGENTQSARVIRFTDSREITKLATVLKSYIQEAIELEKSGAKMPFKKTPERVPIELQSKLGELPALKTAFASLTPGRQRAYILHFAAAKQSSTRAARIEKCLPQILKGKGLNDH